MERLEQQALLALAKVAIKEELIGHQEINDTVVENLTSKFPDFTQKRATFITLNKEQRLRGCMGSLVAHRPLFEDVIENAKNAAFEDPRFQKLTREEYQAIELEISILSEPKELIYHDKKDLKTKIRPNVDGVVLELQGHRATFLPQVWESLSSFELFFANLCQKASLQEACLENHPKISTYQVLKIK